MERYYSLRIAVIKISKYCTLSKDQFVFSWQTDAILDFNLACWHPYFYGFNAELFYKTFKLRFR